MSWVKNSGYHYFDTVDGVHDTVLHDTSSCSGHHMGRQSSTTWESFILDFALHRYDPKYESQKIEITYKT